MSAIGIQVTGLPWAKAPSRAKTELRSGGHVVPAISDGWQEWSKHVLKELERLNDVMLNLQKEVSQARIDIATLQIRAGMWGAASGAIISMGAILVGMLLKWGGK